MNLIIITNKLILCINASEEIFHSCSNHWNDKNDKVVDVTILPPDESTDGENTTGEAVVEDATGSAEFYYQNPTSDLPDAATWVSEWVSSFLTAHQHN